MMNFQRILVAALLSLIPLASSFQVLPSRRQQYSYGYNRQTTHVTSSRPNLNPLFSTSAATPTTIDYEVPEDAILNLKPNAMSRLRELRDKQESKSLVLRMGVRSGGCSGMSYVMDFSTEDEIQEDDVVDDYASENIKCVVDAKSMLYLYGLELDYSDELIGGGFKFFNPNAEESCGCGSSFGV